MGTLQLQVPPAEFPKPLKSLHTFQRLPLARSLSSAGHRGRCRTTGPDTMQSLDFLLSLDLTSAALLFWFTLIFDVPRYLIALTVVSVCGRKQLPPLQLATSVVVAGHNEAKSIAACVKAIEADQIIVVDDGSTDGMWEVIEGLRADGLIHKAIRLPFRSSKITAVNLGLSYCTNEIVFIIDADTILEPGAIAAALPYFADPKVGGVCCNLRVLNESASLTTRFQAIEYAVAISMGRQVGDALDILPNVSGAFGGFRRSAVREVGGLDMEVAEDAALTMKLRRKGYSIRFARIRRQDQRS